jgi:hypothetical protein
MTSVINSISFPLADLGTGPQDKNQCSLEPYSFSIPNKVIIPDLFVSFVAQRPKPNPHYEEVKKQSEEWMKRYVSTKKGLVIYRV